MPSYVMQLPHRCPVCEGVAHWQNVGGFSTRKNPAAPIVQRDVFRCTVCQFDVCTDHNVGLVYYLAEGRCFCGADATHTTTKPLRGDLIRRCAACAAKTHPSWGLRELTPDEMTPRMQ